ncbi:MAG: glycoside hydrolase family 47 [Bacteroidetes bacterium]|jgi:mannosidase alpha-like ER degradation enhancer 2|nr:glycoside hydrolase family 47 [Bacteroidota bacterium]
MRSARFLLCVLFTVCSACTTNSPPNSPAPAPPAPTLSFDRDSLTQAVRAEYLRAWNDYKTYAWGYDDLKPLSKTGANWYDESLLMTPVDALDGMLLMGLDAEADSTREYIAMTLDFDQDQYVKTFEITIRLLGSLLACYQMTDDERLLALADDLGTRLLPAFESPTGLPYTFVNLRTGAVREPVTNPAEVGTLILEFGALSKLTGNPAYYDAAKRALEAVYERRSDLDLVGTAIHVETGEWVETTSHLSGRIDSYYEYLLKGWLLFGDADLQAMWETHRPALHEHLAMQENGGLWYGWVDMHTGAEIAPHFGALDAFFPAVLVLDGDLERAAALQESAYRMWTLHGLEPEILDFRAMEVVNGAYHLRPEIIESAYYLHHATGDPRYLEMGRTFFDGLLQYTKADAGFAAIRDVRTMEKMDAMESFLFGETLKYLYLLFAEDAPLSLDEVVLTTEAHPLRRTWE